MKKLRYTLAAAALLFLVAFLLMAAVLNAPAKQPEAFVPPDFDAAAQAGAPAVPQGAVWQSLDAQVFGAGLCGQVAVTANTADVWLYNLPTNTVWLKLRVLDSNGNTLGETGLIKPDEYVRSVTLSPVPKAGAALTLKLMAYEPYTYYSAGAAELNTNVI